MDSVGKLLVEVDGVVVGVLESDDKRLLIELLELDAVVLVEVVCVVLIALTN